MDQEIPSAVGPYQLLRILESTQLWTEHLALYETAAGHRELYRLWMPGPGTVPDSKAASERLAPLLAVQADNLVRVSDVGISGDTPYVAFEYAPARTLSQVTQAHATAQGPLPVALAIHFAVEVLRGLSKAQKLASPTTRLHHGWLGPQAVSVEAQGRVKLRHLGLAPACLWGPSFLTATLGDAAEELGAQTDVIATARLLKGLLLPPSATRRAPRADLPAALARLLARALSPVPTTRFTSAEALLVELEQVQAKSWEVCTAEKVAELMEQLFGAELEREREEQGRLTIQKGPEPAPGPRQHDSAPPAGTVLGGRYRLLRQIGRGAAGIVFEAEHVELGTVVAVKMLDRDYSRDSYRVERFRREARAASRIGHPNIIRVIDLGRSEDERLFYVMDLVKGENLGQVIKREGFIDKQRAAAILYQVCDALQAAHQMAVIHRDLKPENIVLTRREGGDELAQVVDFGLSLTLDSQEKRLTQEGQAVGTPYYMAPEQVRGDPTDPRTDVYAAGAILYEALTGKPPFDYDTVAETLTAHLHDQPVPAHLRNPEAGVDSALEEVIDRALRKDPADRFQSMVDLSRALRAALEPPARPPDQRATYDPDPMTVPPLDHLDPEVPKRSSLPWLIGVGVVAVAATSFALYTQLGESASEPRGDASLTQGPALVSDGGARDAARSAVPVADASVDRPEAGRAPQPALDAGSPAQAEDGGPAQAPSAEDADRPTRQPSSPSAPQEPSGPSAQELTEQADALLGQGQAAQAQQLYRQALRRSSGNAAAWLGLGRASFELSQHAEAATAFRRAVRLRPTNVRYRLLLAGALQRAGQAAEAAAEYREVLRLEPDNAVAQRMLNR